MVKSVALVSLALAGNVLASPAANPQVSFGSASGVVAGQCAGQSCLLADISGSSGNLPTRLPEGGTQAGWQCVAQYCPECKAAIDRLGGGSASSSRGGLLGGLFGRGLFGKNKRQLFGSSGAAFNARCAPNILIYSKGTTETGELGLTVGPGLNRALSGDSNWSVQGVNYSADSAGNLCVGLPGGAVARGVLEQAAQKCPSSNLWLAGYSQGALVSRNAVAYTTPQVKARVKGLVLYGDPMNGSQIKGWRGPIKTYCRETDAVCTGQFKIGTAHLAYAASSEVRDGANWLKQTAQQLGQGARV